MPDSAQSRDVQPLDGALGFHTPLTSLNDGHPLYFDHDALAREGGDGQEGAARVTAIGEVLAPDRYDAVAVACIVDEDGHGHQAGERAAGALQRPVDKREDVCVPARRTSRRSPCLPGRSSWLLAIGVASAVIGTLMSDAFNVAAGCIAVERPLRLK